MKTEAWAVKGPDGISISSLSTTERWANDRRMAMVLMHQDKEQRERVARDLSVVRVSIIELKEDET